MKEYIYQIVKDESIRLNMTELEVADLIRKALSRVSPKAKPIVPANQIDLLDAIKEAESDV